MTDHVRYDVSDQVITLTLDSPHNRNALSSKLVAELRKGLAEAATDPSVRAVVLTHTGGTFCAGADLSEANAASGHTDADTLADQRSRTMIELLRSIVELPKPVLGCVDGHVRAGGMGLVGACDMVLAGPNSTFALTEARLGLAASIISLTVLPQLSSRAAGRYFLTGEKFGSGEAERLGLVTMAPGNPTAATEALLAEVHKSSPQGLAESKALTTEAMRAGFDAASDRRLAQSARLFNSPEAQEGMTAFLQKRPPSWAQ